MSPPSVHIHFTRFLNSELKQMWLQCRHQVYTHFTNFLKSELKQMWLQCRHQVYTHFTEFLKSENFREAIIFLDNLKNGFRIKYDYWK